MSILHQVVLSCRARFKRKTLLWRLLFRNIFPCTCFCLGSIEVIIISSGEFWSFQLMHLGLHMSTFGSRIQGIVCHEKNRWFMTTWRWLTMIRDEREYLVVVRSRNDNDMVMKKINLPPGSLGQSNKKYHKTKNANLHTPQANHHFPHWGWRRSSHSCQFHHAWNFIFWWEATHFFLYIFRYGIFVADVKQEINPFQRDL